jgi:hypothetical protein
MYLLLRDNKQTGPYSLDEIKAKGLKAYDLVWVEGRSAAWRYPSEVNELSAFAPAVEEQPFDRFYKRAAAQPVAQEASRQTDPSASVIGETAIREGKPAVTVMNEPAVAVMSEAVPRRRIYVTMPGGVSVRETRRERPEVTETGVPVREAFPEYRAARTEYIHEPVAEILPPVPKKKSNRLWPAAAVGFSVLILLAVGVFIGLSIRKDGSGSFKLASGASGGFERQPVHIAAKQLPESPVSGTTQHAAAPALTDSSSAHSLSGIPSTIAANPSQVVVPGQSAGSDPAVRSPAKPISKQKTPVSKQRTDVAKNVAAVPGIAADSAVSHQAVYHRESVHRSDVAESHPVEEKESLKISLANQVAVGTNKYAVGTFGGISNLQVTVSNRSAYSLDLVVVAVSYIQANRKIYKTENLYFRGIGPGSALMLEAPKSSRGITIQYKVTSIGSKELGLSEPGT